MGEVYRARDPRLGRDVAIKVLPEAFARDAERVARFEREARVLASLNHPGIAAIYGFEEAEGRRFLVMELVEGQNLRGPVEIEDAVEIARQMCEALEAAHEKGIVHRDLKPANIKITPAGKVKLLDFGLAALGAGGRGAGAGDATRSIGLTEVGVILGTASYMSPEQARGRAVDRRTDVWAFGCVLYELLAGKQAFGGEDVAEALAAVVRGEPSWGALPQATPPHLRRLLERCLQKDPAKRLRDIGDAGLELEAPPAAPDRPAFTPARRHVLVLGAVLVLVAALAALAAWMLKPSTLEAPLRKLELASGKVQPAYGAPISMAPDGRKIAYVSGNRLWIREFDQFEPRQVAGSEGAIRPFWSPDSAAVAWAAGEKIWKAPAGGGQSLVVCAVPRTIGDSGGGTWQPDGKILFTTGSSGFLEVSAQGGDPRPLLQPNPESELDFHHPSSLPEGRGVVFIVHRKAGVDTLAVFFGGKAKQLLQLPGQRLTNPVYSPTGHLLYYRMPSNPGIWALPFSLSKLAATGEPFLVYPNRNDPTVSSDGTLAFVTGTETPLTRLTWFNRNGQADGAIGDPQQHGTFIGIFPALSPDGRKLAVAAGDPNNNDIWVHDLVRAARTRLTLDAVSKHMLTWSPSGDQIAFVTGGSPVNFSIWLKNANGTGEAQKLVDGSGPEFSPDGKLLVYVKWKPPDDWDIWYLPLAGERKPVAVVQGSGWQLSPRVSPDGQYLAYMSNESGRDEIFLTRFPSGEGKWQVSVNGGFWARWNRSGDRLFYTERDQSLLEVEVRTEPAPVLGKPSKLFTRRPSGIVAINGWADSFDVSADGKRFVVAQPAETDPDATAITVVQNWFAEFRSRSTEPRP